MPGSNDRYQNILEGLNLIEGTDLYKLAELFLEHDKDKSNNEKQDAALKYFFELTERDVHDTIVDEYSLVVGNKRTPLVLLLQLQRDKNVGDKAQILKAIKQNPMHMNLLDARALLMAINHFFDAPNHKRWFYYELFYVQDLKEKSVYTVDIGYQQQIFNVLKECFIQNRSAWIDLLKKIVQTMKDYSYYDQSRTVVKLLLDCQSNDFLDDIIPSVFPFEKKALTLYEWVIENDNDRYLEILFPRMHLDLRWKLFLIAIHFDKQSCISHSFMNDSDVMGKFKQEGQLLLTDYLNASDAWQRASEYGKRSYLTTKNVELFLHAGAIYDKRLEMRDAVHAPYSIIIPWVVEFFKALSTQTLTLTECVKTLRPLRPYKKENYLYFFPLNVRDEEGNTVYSIIFNILMQENLNYFNTLLYSIMTADVDLNLKNNKGEIIYELAYLSSEQKMFMNIAERIGLAHRTFSKLREAAREAAKEKNKDLKIESECAIIKLAENINRIIVDLIKMPSEKISCLMYFEILHLYLSFKDYAQIENFNYAICDQQMEDLKLVLQNKTKEQLWQAINEVLAYHKEGVSIRFEESYNEVLNELLKKLKSESFNLTWEQLKEKGVENFYKVAFSLENENKFTRIQRLLDYDIPFEVIVDEQTNNSLFHAMMECGKWDIVQSMMDKVDLCPGFLIAANVAGDTPLHFAIKYKLPIELFKLLVKAIKAKNYDADIENHAHLSPLYGAFAKLELKYAHIIFKKLDPSLTREGLHNNARYTAFDWWVFAITHFIFPNVANAAHKKQMKHVVRNMMLFGSNLLSKGACLPVTSQYKPPIEQFQKFVRGHLTLSSKEFEEIFMPFNNLIAKVEVAWNLIMKIEKDKVTETDKDKFYGGYLRVFPCLMTTRRLTDKKTMWEVLFEKKLRLEQEQTSLEKNVQEDNAASIKACRERILFVNELMSIFILYGLNPERIDEIHQKLMHIRNECNKLADYQKAYLASIITKPRARTVLEIKEEKETKEVVESLQEMASPEQQVLDLGKTLLKQLEAIQEPYPVFVATLSLFLTESLFQLNRTDNSLLISNQILKLAYEFIHKAEQCSRNSKFNCLDGRKSITQLHAKIFYYLPNKDQYCAFAGMEKCLRMVMSMSAIENLQATMPDAYLGMYETIMLHGKKSLNRDSLPTEHQEDLCSAIPEAFKRAEQEITILNQQLEDSRMRERILQEEIAKLKASHAESNTDKEFSTRKAATQEVADAKPVLEKRQKLG